ncbi:MAG: hypothetical protein GY834_09185 [Bacteroidetes bacterium]|nr:hypothetical protein [Bacteroidota bacterium]
MAYNLKKYLKFTRNKVVSLAKTAEISRSFIIDQLRLILLICKQSIYYQLQIDTKRKSPQKGLIKLKYALKTTKS